MLEVTSIRDGAVLDRNHGRENGSFLEINVEGITSSRAEVKVNGVKADRCDQLFSAPVRLTEKVNRITVESSDYYGVRTQTLTAVWDKKSFPRYNFFFDDCTFFLYWIAKNNYKSIFEEMFINRLRSIHEKYGTKFMLNCFYHDDHHDFSISEFPDRYKKEFVQNSSWLRLSFHAKSEFPDRPYQNSSAETLAGDFDLVKKEIIRFAGEETFIPPMVIHWAITNPANFSVLQERGTKCLAGGFLGTMTRPGEQHSIRVTDIGYHYEQDVAHYILKKHLFYDRFYDLFLLNNLCCCNSNSIPVLEEKFSLLAADRRDTISLMSHEQYSYSDYFNFIPDHLDRVETACRLAYEAKYVPVWFPEGLLGNSAWEK